MERRKPSDPSAGKSRACDEIPCAEMPDFIVRMLAARDLLEARPGLLDAIERHLSDCTACREQYDALRVALDATDLDDKDASETARMILRGVAAQA
jgi:hypothetical protein